MCYLLSQPGAPYFYSWCSRWSKITFQKNPQNLPFPFINDQLSQPPFWPCILILSLLFWSEILSLPHSFCQSSHQAFGLHLLNISLYTPSSPAPLWVSLSVLTPSCWCDCFLNTLPLLNLTHLSHFSILICFPLKLLIWTNYIHS